MRDDEQISNGIHRSIRAPHSLSQGCVPAPPCTWMRRPCAHTRTQVCIVRGPAPSAHPRPCLQSIHPPSSIRSRAPIRSACIRSPPRIHRAPPPRTELARGLSPHARFALFLPCLSRGTARDVRVSHGVRSEAARGEGDVNVAAIPTPSQQTRTLPDFRTPPTRLRRLDSADSSPLSLPRLSWGSLCASASALCCCTLSASVR